MSEEMSLLNLSIENNVGILKLNNPPVNVLNRSLLEQLDNMIDLISDNDEIKVLILTGEGSAFAAGADIKSMPQLKAREGEEMASYGQDIFRKLETLEKVSICAINGVALGGGMELAMSCDIRIISEKAKIGQPEINLGIIPGYGGTQRLTRIVGKAKSKEIILTGDNITAQEAFDLGIATKITTPENLMPTAIELANKIASKGQVAVRAAKKAIDEGFEETLNESMRTEAKYFGLVCDSEDKNEGVIAFMEKRKPNFKDR